MGHQVNRPLVIPGKEARRAFVVGLYREGHCRTDCGQSLDTQSMVALVGAHAKLTVIGEWSIVKRTVIKPIMADQAEVHVEEAIMTVKLERVGLSIFVAGHHP